MNKEPVTLSKDRSMRFIATLLFSFIITLTQAQLEVRPFIGLNFSAIDESPMGVSTQAKQGGQLGANMLIGNRFFVNPGISYFSRFTQFNYDDILTGNQTIEGVSIPLLLGFRLRDLADLPILNMRVFAGPSYMILTTTNYEDDGFFLELIHWNESQWGGQVGAGIDLFIFFIDIAYEFGLTNLSDGGRLISGEFDELRQNTFLMNAGLRLKFAQ